MDITYLGHSGFLVELQENILLFDYYTGVIPELPQGKKLYVFASHHHEDHMNTEVFRLREKHPHVNYVLSNDIYKELPLQYGVDDAYFVRPNAAYTLDTCTIHTLPSTDCGVAFLVACEEKHIYHAGDLNLWLWPGMEKSQSFEMMRRYTQYTAPLKDYSIDVAFLTLDNRQEKGAYSNIDYYMRHFSIGACVPMHYFGSTKIADRFLQDPSSEPYRHKIQKMEVGELWHFPEL